MTEMDTLEQKMLKLIHQCQKKQKYFTLEEIKKEFGSLSLAKEAINNLNKDGHTYIIANEKDINIRSIKEKNSERFLTDKGMKQIKYMSYPYIIRLIVNLKSKVFKFIEIILKIVLGKVI